MAVSRSGESSVIDEDGRERERYKVPYGATIVGRATATESKPGQIVANWDPHTHPIITEVAGVVRFEDFVEGVTVQPQIDEITGLTDARGHRSEARGTARQGSAAGGQAGGRQGQGAQYCPAPRSRRTTSCRPAPSSSMEDGAEVGVGDVIARIPQESSKTRDITGGLPRVADLFEARKPKEPAVLAECIGHGQLRQGHQGQAASGDHGRGRRRHEELIPKWRHVNVFEGEHVEKGEIIVDGEPNPHDILRLHGRRTRCADT